MKTDAIPGLTIKLRVGGEPLEEHDADELFVPTKATKYVEAVSGEAFDVHVTALSKLARHPDDNLLVHILLDGKKCVGKLLDLGRQKTPIMGKSIEGVDENTAYGSVFKRFVFADLQTNDGPIGVAKKLNVKSLGEVTVKCWWVHQAGKLHNDSSSSFESDFKSSIPEKCLKGRAISNHATLGNPEPRHGKVNYVDVTYPYGRDTIAEFTFKYRSRHDLQVEGIIERSPTPPPLEERDPNTLTREELRELLARRDQELKDLSHIKREKRERSTTIIDGDDDEITITNDRSKRRRTSDDSAIDVVDLTGD